MNQLGRNDPCPCGSGKKYKKCCSLKTPMQRHTFSNLSSESARSSMQRITGMISKTLREVKPEAKERLQKELQKRVGKATKGTAETSSDETTQAPSVSTPEGEKNNEDTSS